MMIKLKTITYIKNLRFYVNSSSSFKSIKTYLSSTKIRRSSLSPSLPLSPSLSHSLPLSTFSKLQSLIREIFRFRLLKGFSFYLPRTWAKKMRGKETIKIIWKANIGSMLIFYHLPIKMKLKKRDILKLVK
jgi:hypothetical protein